VINWRQKFNDVVDELEAHIGHVQDNSRRPETRGTRTRRLIESVIDKHSNNEDSLWYECKSSEIYRNIMKSRRSDRHTDLTAAGNFSSMYFDGEEEWQWIRSMIWSM
jgi:hypothetical protein